MSFQGTPEEAVKLCREILEGEDTKQFYEGTRLALELSNFDLVKQFVYTGEIYNYSDLMLDACRDDNNLEIIHFLIDYGWDIHCVGGGFDMTTLMIASSNGSFEIVKFLVKSGVDLNVTADSCNESALSMACDDGHIDIVKFLIESKCDVNGADCVRNASSSGHVNILRFLIKSGANVNDVANEPLTPSVKKGHFDIVKILVNSGIELVADDRYKKRSLIQIAADNKHNLIAVLLMENGCEINSLIPFDENLNKEILNRQQYLLQIKYIIKYASVFEDDDPNVPNLIFQFTFFLHDVNEFKS